MDFTDAFRISRIGTRTCAEYSPGSTFLATLHHIPTSGAESILPNQLASSSSSSSSSSAVATTNASETHATLVQIRSSATLQVVKTWTLPFSAHSVRWSNDGTMLLFVGTERFVVMSIEADVQRRRQTSISRAIPNGTNPDCLLDVIVGAEGMHKGHGAQWVASQAVCCFSADTLLTTMYDVRTGHLTVHTSVKVARVFMSPSSRFVALLVRQESLDKVAVYSLSDGQKGLHLVECFPTQTNDAVGLSWSPDERFIAVWEGVLEYKVQIFSIFGHQQASFSIEEMEPSTAVPNTFRKAPIPHVAGGLGVRDVRWSSDGKWIAIGDYGDRVRVLETGEWSQAAAFDVGELVSTRLSEQLLSQTAAGWREPQRWQAQTGGRSIVKFDSLQVPIGLPKLQSDLSKLNPKAGICWMEWNGRGDLLAVRCESVPSALYVFSTSVDDERSRPCLCTIVVFSSPITHASWRPSRRSSEIAVVCRTQAVYVWNAHADGVQSGQIAEAIPIPIESFAALHVSHSPDGQMLLIMSETDTFTCAMDAASDWTSSQKTADEGQSLGRL